MDSAALRLAFALSQRLAPAWAVSMRCEGGRILVTDERGRDWEAIIMSVEEGKTFCTRGPNRRADVIVPVYGPMERQP